MSYQWPEYYRPEVMKGAGGSGRLSSYSIALEAWRRGLQVTFTHPRIRFFEVSDGRNTIRFDHSRPASLTTKEAYRMVENKFSTIRMLKAAGVEVPLSMPFNAAKSTFADVADAADNAGFPVVLKPLKGSRGLGVLVNIGDEAELRSGYEWLVNSFGARWILLERFYEGGDHRVYVVGGTYVAAGLKIPARVVGDGMHSIRELIDQKNKRRMSNPFNASALIKVDYEVEHYVAKAGYDFDSVPESGIEIILRGKANVSAGGEFQDCTNELPQHIREAAIKSVEAIPGLSAAGVDVLYDQSKPQGEDYVVIEMNSRAHIALNMYPNYGQGQDMPAAIVDSYFPESSRLEIPGLKDLRINLPEAVAPIRGGSVGAVRINPIPKHGLPVRKQASVRIYGDVTAQQENRIIVAASRSSVSGWLNVKKGKMVVAGEGEAVASFCERLQSIIECSVLSSRDWTGVVEVGFSLT